MLRKCFFIVLIALWTGVSFAQWKYIAAKAQNIAGTYTDLGTSGAAITTNFTGGAMTFDNANSSIQNIGFSFYYNGIAFTQFVLNSNGFIKLGNAAPASASNFNVLAQRKPIQSLHSTMILLEALQLLNIGYLPQVQRDRVFAPYNLKM